MANAISNATKADAPALCGLVLTGGRSTRMGQDKSRLVYHAKPQREHLIDLLRPYCTSVYWSVNAEQAAELTGTAQPFIVDAFDWPGPLNGILSAFGHNARVAWLVVACDLPLLTTRSLDALVQHRDPANVATVFYDSDGQQPDPLLGIYEPTFGPIAEASAAKGQFSPRQLLRDNPVQLLVAPDIRELTNVNDRAGIRTLDGHVRA